MFPAAISPFEVRHRLTVTTSQPSFNQRREDLLDKLRAAGMDVILDDRDERPGSMFADWSLSRFLPPNCRWGTGVKEGKLEYKGRRADRADDVGGRWRNRIFAAKVMRLIVILALVMTSARGLAGTQQYEPLAASVQACLTRRRSGPCVP